MNDLTRGTLDVLAPWVFAWQSREDVAARLGVVVERELAKVDDLVAAASFREACPVDGTSAHDYLNRVLTVAGAGTFVAGPRFRSFDASEPFVDVVAADRAAPDADLDRLVAAVEAGFAWQRPRWARVLVPPGGGPGTPDVVVHAGLVGAIQGQPRPSAGAAIELRAWTDLASVRSYEQAVEEIRRDEPERARWFYARDEDSFARLLGEGMVFDVLAAGEWAGVIAASPRPTLGLAGYQMSEELLTARWRGRGMAAAMQRALVDTLDASGNAVIAGEIDAANVASIRTAARVGRPEIARFVFLPTAWQDDDRPRW